MYSSDLLDRFGETIDITRRGKANGQKEMESSSSFTTTTTNHSSAVKLLKYVKSGYHYLANNILIIIIILLVIPVTVALKLGPGERAAAAVRSLRINVQEESQLHLQLVCCLLILVILLASTVYFMSKPPTIYLVDYACFKPPVDCRVSSATFIEHLSFSLSPESLAFTKRIIERSGLGEETSLPTPLHYIHPSPTLSDARSEAELLIFSSIDTLLSNNPSITPTDIDVLILNSSLFNPIPSLTSTVVHNYKMKSTIKTFNLGSMGCSGSSIAVDLAADILRSTRRRRSSSSYALVVSTEILTSSFYKGDVREMLLPNCLFRMGCAALLLSNDHGGGRGRGGRGRKAKYKLSHVVRTNVGAVDDKAYRCVYGMTDSRGNVGVSLSKDLMKVAGDALEANIVALAPKVLPVSEKLRYVFSVVVGWKVWWWWSDPEEERKEGRRRYVPDFKTAFEHICVHAGGKAVVDGVQRSLGLSDGDVEASRMTLHRFGNTSSSGLWYVLAYIEAKGRMKRGDRVWQIFFGSGYKCNSVVWECIRDVDSGSCGGGGAWGDCIDRYPVEEMVRSRVRF